MIVFSLSAVSADDLQTTDSGEVSGDVDVATVNPGGTSGELTYDIPNDAKEIKSADVYVNVYSGSASPTYGANANVTLKTQNGENQIASEELWIEDGTTDGTIYPVNNHTTKCFSDYQMHYDITDSLKGLNGSSIAIKVDTFNMTGKLFDGRIKLIALVLAYDDGDDDTISYWIDSTQRWTKTDVATTFNTEAIMDIENVNLTNVALSSSDGSYKLNGEMIGDADYHSTGSGFYYQYNTWNVTSIFKEGQKTEFSSLNIGYSIKSVLTVLKVKSNLVTADLTFNTEYNYKGANDACYAGTNNVLTIKANSNKAGKYVVELLAGDAVVNSTEVDLDGENASTVLLTDPAIRPIDETTVSGADNNKVIYTVNVKLGDSIVGTVNKTVPVLYNGYAGKDLEFNETGYEALTPIQFTGDIVIDTKGESSYLGTSAMNITETWTVTNSDIVKAFIYVPYNWFDAKKYIENEGMFKISFNGANITPVGFYRDQANVGSSGKYGYGVFIYDVTDLIAAGDNTFVLNKIYASPAVYPTSLVYLYNSNASDVVKTAYFVNGADLLSNDYNNAGRIIKADSNVVVAPFKDATLYVFAASAEKGESNIVVNGKLFEDVWSGTSKTTNLFTTDISDIALESNNISFVATGKTIMALHEIIVTTPIASSVDFNTEYNYKGANDACYAGTNNTLTITVNSNEAGKYVVELLAGDAVVNSTEVDLDGENKTIVLLTDPAIRPIDETTVAGAANNKVIYTVNVKLGDSIVGTLNKTVPVLYNGYAGKDLEFNETGYEALTPIQFTGDIVIDTKGESSYASGSANVNEIWDVTNSDIVKAFIYVPYNWFDPAKGTENEAMFNVTFNGANITPIAFYRDQANVGSSGNKGYGVLIYDVTDYIVTGNNTFALKKLYATPTVYPTSLVYLYNSNASNVVKTAYFVNGADLLSNSYNKAGRIIKADSNVTVAPFKDATLYVFAASAEKNEANIVVNGKLFEDVWSGTSKTTNLFTTDITDIALESNNISFVATGNTILALHEIIVTTPIASSVDFNTEYNYKGANDACYAGTNNVLTIKVNANEAGKYVVELLDGEVVVNSTEVTLDGENVSTVSLTDPAIRPIDETTVAGAANNKVIYTVNVKLGDSIVGTLNKTVPVLYNGYAGKDLEFNETGYEALTPIQFTGDIVIDTKGESSYLGTSAMNITETWTVTNSDVVKAFIYVPYNWFDAKKYIENESMFKISFNGANITPVGFYRDQANVGSSGKYGYGVFIYDVTDLIIAGDNTFVLNKIYTSPAVYPTSLVYLYNSNASNVVKTAYFVNGADLLSNDYNNAGRIIKADSNVTIAPFKDATLYVFAASAEKGESNIVVNGKLFEDVWSGTSKTTNLFTTDISDIALESNNISFVATGKTIMALHEIIVTTPIASSVDFNTEYNYKGANDACYAGTNNVLTIKVNANEAGKYVVELLDGDAVVNSTEVTLDGENVSTVSLTDPTIRPIDETTVAGAANNKVIYTVNVKLGDSIVGTLNKTVPVLYNGYAGKDLEFNETGYEAIAPFKFTGELVVETKGESSYASGSTNVNEIWDVTNSDIVKAYIYVPYNWFDPAKGTENEAMFNVAFNGVNITPIAFYRDQANVGSSGNKGYGVLIYDVTDYIVTGNNTFALKKLYATPTVYPTTLVYAYNKTASGVIRTAYLLNGADLLSNDYNKAGRTIKADANVTVNMTNVRTARLYVFASSAQAGEGNIVFNGETYENVWNGTSKTTDLFTADVSSIVNSTNSLSFVSTGSTILALQQIIVTREKVPIKTTMSYKSLSTTYDSDKVYYVTVLDEANNPVKDTVITFKVYTGKSYKLYYATTNSRGVAAFKGASRLDVGSHDVEIYSSSKVYDIKKVKTTIKISKSKTTVKAPKVTAKHKKTTYFKVTVKNKVNNKAVSKVKVRLKVYTGKKFKTYIITTNKDGVAKFNTNVLNVGSHNVVMYTSSPKYTIDAKSSITIKR